MLCDVEVDTVTGWASERERVRIVAARRERGYSSHVFALLAGCARTHWIAVEQGHRPLSPGLAAAALAALGLASTASRDPAIARLPR